MIKSWLLALGVVSVALAAVPSVGGCAAIRGVLAVGTLFVEEVLGEPPSEKSESSSSNPQSLGPPVDLSPPRVSD